MQTLLAKVYKFFQYIKLIQSYRTEPTLSPIVPKKTVLSQIIHHIKQIVSFISAFVKNFQQLNSQQKTNWIIAVCFFVGVCVKVIREYYSSWGNGGHGGKGGFGSQESSQGLRKNMSRLPSRQEMLKKNPSLLSMKQYKSHSDSGSESNAQSSLKQLSSKKLNKDIKQFCTDIETESHEQNMQTKRDKFFFSLMGTYQKAGRQNKQNNHSENKLIQEDQYSCEYQIEGEGIGEGKEGRGGKEGKEGKRQVQNVGTVKKVKLQ